MDQKIGQEDKSQINAIGGENRSGNGSGSTSSIVAVNNDTSLKMNSGKLDLSRPTSPQLNAVQTSTGNLTPSATSSTTVKSNFLHWLASSMPSKQQQSQQQQSQNMGISNSLTSGSGNFGIMSNITISFKDISCLTPTDSIFDFIVYFLNIVSTVALKFKAKILKTPHFRKLIVLNLLGLTRLQFYFVFF